jgi:hypothetical protein
MFQSRIQQPGKARHNCFAPDLVIFASLGQAALPALGEGPVARPWLMKTLAGTLAPVVKDAPPAAALLVGEYQAVVIPSATSSC